MGWNFHLASQRQTRDSTSFSQFLAHAKLTKQVKILSPSTLQRVIGRAEIEIVSGAAASYNSGLMTKHSETVSGEARRVSRRAMLQATALGSAGVVLTPALSAGRALAASAPEIAPTKPFEFEAGTIFDLQERMKSGTLTASALTNAYLRRIEEVDKNGPALNSVIELNPDALAIAGSLDRERKQKGPRGPMHGIPVLIKDNIDTSDRMQTTAGSLALLGSKPPLDSSVARKSQRMGQHAFQSFDQRMERSRWADEESVRSRSESVRIEFRLRRGNFCEPLRCGGWDRDRRIYRMSIVSKRDRWHQANTRPYQPRRNHSYRAQSGHRRADGTDRPRRRDPVERTSWARYA